MALEAARLLVHVGGDIREGERALDRMDRRVEHSGGLFTRMLPLAATAAGVAIAGGFAASISAAANFEGTLNMLQAVTGATGDQMAALSKRAKDLGADVSLPATSAADAALAMTELAKAGLSVNDTMAAAKGVLQLAAAGALSEARAAEITANALNAYKLSGDQAVRIADLLAAGANASSAEVTDMADSLQMAAAVFAGAKIPIEATVTAIAMMANQGIKGSDAGTSLKQMMLSLEAPTNKAAKLIASMGISIYDAQGAMLPFRDLIGQFSTKMAGLTQQQQDQALATIFGSDAVRSARIVMLGGLDAYDKTFEAVTKQGAAAELAAARTKGFNGALESLKSQIETIAINVGSVFLPVLADMAKWLANALALFIDQDWNNLPQVFANLGAEISKLDDVISGLLGLDPTAYANAWEAFAAQLQVVGQKIDEQLQAWGQALVDWIGPRIGPMLAELGKLWIELNAWAYGTALPALVTALAEWGKAFIEWIVPKIPGMIAEADKLYAALGDWITGTALPGIAAALVGWAEAFSAWVVPATGDLMAALPGLHDQLIAWIGEKASVDLPYALDAWAAAFVKWHEQAIADLPGILQSIIDTIVGWVQTIGQGMMADAGNAMGGSFLDGLKESIASIPSRIAGDLQNVASVGKNIANNLIAGYKDGMEQRSPSKVMERLAEDSVQGLVNGFKRSAPEVKGALQSMLKSMTSDDVSMIAVWNEIANKWGGSFANAIEKAANVALDGRSSGGLGNSPDFTKWSPGMPRTADDMSPAEYMQTFGAIPKAAKVSAAEAAGAYQSLWKSVTDDTISHTTVLREIAQRYGEDFARSIDKQVLAQRGLSSSLTDTVLGAKNLGTTLGTTVAQGAGTASAAMMKFGSAATDAGNAAADAFTKANASFADWDKNKAAITERAMAATFAAPRGQGASGVAYYGDATSNTLNAWSTLMAKANAAGMGARADELRRGGFMNPYQAAEALAEESRTSLRRSIGMGAKALGSGGSGGGNTVTVQPGAIQFVINGNNPSEIRRVVGEVLDEHMGFDAYAAGV